MFRDEVQGAICEHKSANVEGFKDFSKSLETITKERQRKQLKSSFSSPFVLDFPFFASFTAKQENYFTQIIDYPFKL